MNFDKYKTKGAYHYGWYQTEDWYKKCVDRCVEFCKGTTLDVGCGDGVVSNMIAEKGYEVTGIDNNWEGVNLAIKAKTRSNVEFLWLDFTQSSNREWEYMVCLNVIEHLQDPEAIKRTFHKNITKGAIIITDMPQEKPSKYHVKEFTPKELADMFSEYKVVPFKIDDNFHGIEIYK